MTQVMDFYTKLARQKRSTMPWLAKLQSEALAQLAAQGFPTRHDEEWKYTKVDALLQECFEEEETCAAVKQVPAVDRAPYPALSIQNGKACLSAGALAALPAGVIVKPLSQALVEEKEVIVAHFLQRKEDLDAFSALNTAMLEDGLFIYIPQNAQVETPLVLSHWQDLVGTARYLRHLILVEEGAVATIIEDYAGAPQSAYFTNAITEISLKPGAVLTHIAVFRDGDAAYHIGQTRATVEKDARFDSHVFALGGKLLRRDLTVHFADEYGTCLLNGIYAPTAGHMDHHTTIVHQYPHCQSKQDYKGVLKGHAHAVFNGKVFVAPGAYQTQAEQQNKNLLLSSAAEVNTKPQLEIFADDVMCTHGATVGQLDEEALFYMAQRGIAADEAARFLIRGFIEENIARLADKTLATWVIGLLNKQIE